MHKQAPSNVRGHLARILLATLLLVGCSAGCQKSVGVRRLRFETVAQGQAYRYGIVTYEEGMRIMVAANEEEIRVIREDATEPAYSTALQAWDRVDMARDIIVAIVMVGSRPYEGPAISPVEVVDVFTIDSTVRLFVRIHRNPPGTVTEHISMRPYHIVAVPRSKLPEGDVRFIVDTTEGDRFAETTYTFQSKE